MIQEQMQSRIADLLQGYAAGLRELVGVLETEHHSLVEKNLVKLEDSTIKKQSLLQDIAVLEQELDDLSRTSDFDPEILKVDQSFNQLNRQIKNLVNECKNRNDVNGAIIETSRQFNQRLLAILLGNEEKDHLYDAKGKNSKSPGNQSVARI